MSKKHRKSRARETPKSSKADRDWSAASATSAKLLATPSTHQDLDALTSLQVELSATRLLLHKKSQRLEEIERVLGSRGTRSYSRNKGLLYRLKYSYGFIALRIPLWSLTFNLKPRLRRWLDAKAILDSTLFDEECYLSQNQDVAASKVDPLYHYVLAGAREGRNPNPLFDTAYYLERIPAVTESGINPLVHYLHYGAEHGLSPSPYFDTAFYLKEHPEVAEQGINPLRHYIETGLWRGYRAHAPVALTETQSRTLQDSVPSSVPRSKETTKHHRQVRTIAFYLPQFHPIPENNEWWGEGFTEWTNVCTASPCFPGHQQPHIPSDLGFYDLRVAETRVQQATLAQTYGIDGFCYYHYWFGGRELLERPLKEMLSTGLPDFPFCLCWANENWTRRWDGCDDDILLAQDHRVDADNRFIEAVLPALVDRRYICVDKKPMLLVYRADLLADPAATTDRWREVASKAGLPGLHLCAVEFHLDDPRPFGFDALVEFPPHSLYLHGFAKEISVDAPDFLGRTFDYPASVEAVTHRPAKYPLYRGVMPGWDNTPRRGVHAWCYHKSTPESYCDWLARMLEEASQQPGTSDRFVFINAWNEWAEGAFLEPSQAMGRSYLKATREAVQRSLPEQVDSGNRDHQAVPVSAHSTWDINQEHRASRAPHSHPVLLVSHDAARAGAQLILLEIAKHLARCADLEVFLLFLQGGEIEDDARKYIHVLNAGDRPPADLADNTTLESIITDLAGLNPLVALCNTVVSSEAALLCQRAGIPVLSLLYELPTSISASLGQHHVDNIVAASRRIVVASDFVKQALVRTYEIEPDSLAPLHTGYLEWQRTDEPNEARERVLSELGIEKDTFVVLGCGTIHHRKGTDLFVQVAREAVLMGSTRELHFLWIGAPQDGLGFLKWCEHDIEASGLQDVVTLAGPRTNTADYYAAADAFALTSREDPFPMVNLEAMAHGLPVVAFDGAGGAPEALCDRSGVVVPYLDVKAMARSLITLCEAPQYHEEISRNAKLKAETHYRWQRYMDDLLGILKDDFGYRPAASTSKTG